MSAQLLSQSIPIRKECPPGACICERDSLLAAPQADLRILMLTREEEKKLLARIEAIDSYADLKHMTRRMFESLGMTLRVAPGAQEVRTVRGLDIELMKFPGLCQKTRQAIPAALRRCLEKNPAIVYAILDAHDLFGGSDDAQPASQPA